LQRVQVPRAESGDASDFHETGKKEQARIFLPARSIASLKRFRPVTAGFDADRMDMRSPRQDTRFRLSPKLRRLHCALSHRCKEIAMRAHIRREAFGSIPPAWYLVPLTWVVAAAAAAVWLDAQDSETDPQPAGMAAGQPTQPIDLPALDPAAQAAEAIQNF
jgi:hypothetical protein